MTALPVDWLDSKRGASDRAKARARYHETRDSCKGGGAKVKGNAQREFIQSQSLKYSCAE